MNQNKKFACFLVAVLVMLQLYILMMVNGRAMTMKEEAISAQTAAEGAQLQVNTQNFALTAKKDQTDAIRKFGEIWETYLAQTATEELASSLIEDKVRNGKGMFQTDGTSAVLPNATGTYITKIYQATKSFDDDFQRSLQWIGDLEEGLAACRLTSVSLSKSQVANHVTMSITANLPLIDALAKRNP
jgi:hypothetical protein